MLPRANLQVPPVRRLHLVLLLDLSILTEVKLKEEAVVAPPAVQHVKGSVLVNFDQPVQSEGRQVLVKLEENTV